MANRPLIAGNWKMNLLAAEAVALGEQLAAYMQAAPRGFDMAVCPPAVLLPAVATAVRGSPVMRGGQDCHPNESGAHTGDISAAMLADAGCVCVIVGHSERRSDHAEDDALVRNKASAALRAGLTAIVCVGETGAERDAGQADAVVARQLAGSLPVGASAHDVVIAYEPVWAIGTGRPPVAGDIRDMHSHIRASIGAAFAEPQQVRLLYGGSVKAANAVEILAIANVDGALVGGASLQADGFIAICEAI